MPEDQQPEFGNPLLTRRDFIRITALTFAATAVSPSAVVNAVTKPPEENYEIITDPEFERIYLEIASDYLKTYGNIDLHSLTGKVTYETQEPDPTIGPIVALPYIGKLTAVIGNTNGNSSLSTGISIPDYKGIGYPGVANLFLPFPFYREMSVRIQDPLIPEYNLILEMFSDAELWAFSNSEVVEGQDPFAFITESVLAKNQRALAISIGGGTIIQYALELDRLMTNIIGTPDLIKTLEGKLVTFNIEENALYTSILNAVSQNENIRLYSFLFEGVLDNALLNARKDGFANELSYIRLKLPSNSMVTVKNVNVDLQRLLDFILMPPDLKISFDVDPANPFDVSFNPNGTGTIVIENPTPAVINTANSVVEKCKDLGMNPFLIIRPQFVAQIFDLGLSDAIKEYFINNIDQIMELNQIPVETKAGFLAKILDDIEKSDSTKYLDQIKNGLSKGPLITVYDDPNVQHVIQSTLKNQPNRFGIAEVYGSDPYHPKIELRLLTGASILNSMRKRSPELFKKLWNRLYGTQEDRKDKKKVIIEQ